MSTSLSEIFKVLSDENRLKIVQIVAKGKMCANEILGEIGISQPTLSHHMKVLVDAELVSADKVGTQVYYELNRSKVSCLCHFVREISGKKPCSLEEN